MSRPALRSFVLAVTLLGVACWRDSRPDVFVIVLDTVRADHLGVYGYERVTSPNLDAFARDAVVYRTAIAPGTWTPPSHASLLTGLMPSTHGVGNADEAAGGGRHALDAAVETLPERLRAAGYRTAAFIGNSGYLSPLFGLSQGFDKYRVRGLQSVDELSRVLIRWLERHAGPAFVLVNVIDAHEPYEPPPPYDRMFPGYLERPVPRHPQDELQVHGRLPSPDEAAHYVGRYDGEIRHIDDRLGDLFAALRRLGRWDDALIIVTADHGELFGERGRWGHGGDPTYALVRVPLIVKYPARARTGDEAAPASLVDVPATVLATVGLPPLDSNTRPLWEPRTAPAVSEQPGPNGVTRAAFGADGLALVETVRDGTRTLGLYDYRRDPAEQSPLDPETHAAAARLDADLRRLVAALPTPRLGPVVHPRSDANLAARLRALGYLR